MLQFFFHCRYLLFILLPLVAIFTLLEIKSIKFCFPALKEHFVHQKRNEQILRKQQLLSFGESKDNFQWTRLAICYFMARRA